MLFAFISTFSGEPNEGTAGDQGLYAGSALFNRFLDDPVHFFIGTNGLREFDHQWRFALDRQMAFDSDLTA